ncbi:uncharacterized protein [Periplaneta americana]|uniref:uncharacterized protein n=1 Tax=Periplaneta americana TaxID=6978 RepID=UPI0037E8AA0C
MPVYNQPIRLERQCLQIFVKCLVDICVRLLNSGRAAASEKDALGVCQRVRGIIHDTVPYTLANCVTSETLNYLDSRYHDIQDAISSSSCKNVFQNFVKAILHPQVTKLDVTGKWKHISNIVLNQIETLPELQILRFCVRDVQIYDSFKHLIPKCLCSLMNLRCFTLPVYCSDEIINTLVKYSPGLVHLDVSESKAVTNMSTDRILKFPYLQSLNISRTGINLMGYKCLLERSGKSLHRLQGFGLSIAEASQVMSLPCFFHGLRRLSLNMNFPAKEYRLDTLHLLKGLEELEVSGLALISVPQLPNLKVLRLAVNYLEVQDLPRNCPRLEKLVIKATTLKCSKLTESFHHLCCLSIWAIELISICNLLSATPKLVNLKLITGVEYYANPSFVTVFGKSLHLMEYLENLFMCSPIGFIYPHTFPLITSNCSTMAQCFVSASEDMPEDLKTMYKDCVGVQIRPLKCCMMHFHNFSE